MLFQIMLFTLIAAGSNECLKLSEENVHPGARCPRATGRGGICGKTCLNVGVSNGEEVNVDILKCPENYPYIAKIYFEECNDGKTFIPIGVDCADSKGVKPQCQLSGSSN